MENPTNITLDFYNACRSNIVRARKNDGHYDFSELCRISGFRVEDLLNNLQYCAEKQYDNFAIKIIQHAAEALLSAYEIQSRTYKQHK